MLALLNSALLPWLAAAAVPIAIHLLTRKTRRKLDLPTLKFLQRTMAHQSRLFRWRHLLLLLLRVLAVVALTLAFTRPTFTSALKLPAGESAGVIVLLDTSQSMSYSAGGLTSLARAKGEVLKLLQDLRPGDRANLVLCGAQPRAVMSEPTPDLASLQNALRAVQPTEERADPASAVNLAVEQLTRTNTRTQRLYLFSDFQRNNWADARFDAVPAGARVVFVNTEAGVRENLGIASVRIRPSTPRAGEPVTAECEVFNSGPGLRNTTVTLVVGEGTRLQQPVAVGPYSSATVAFTLRYDTPLRLQCTASLPGDMLTADDARRAIIDLRKMASVVLVTDDNTTKVPSAGFFLARALHPDPGSTTGFRVTAVRPAELNNPTLQSADAVIVCGVPSMPAQQHKALARYVLDGGNLVWFLYGQGIKEQFAGISTHLPPAEPMPFQIEDVADLAGNGKGFVTLAEARYESPLLRAFKDPAAADLGRIHFRRFCVTTEVDPRAEVLLRFEDGTVAAARVGEGSGSLLLVNMAPAPDWSDLPRQEAFVPLMHEFLKGMMVRDSALREFSPGGAASATIPALSESRGRSVTCTGPTGATIPVTVEATTGSVVVERAAMSGFYTVNVGGRPEAVIPVNGHPDEIDLRSIDPRELESRARRSTSYLAGGDGKDADLDTLHRGVPIWHWLLLAALLFLFAEQSLGQLRPRKRA